MVVVAMVVVMVEAVEEVEAVAKVMAVEVVVVALYCRQRWSVERGRRGAAPRWRGSKRSRDVNSAIANLVAPSMHQFWEDLQQMTSAVATMAALRDLPAPVASGGPRTCASLIVARRLSESSTAASMPSIKCAFVRICCRACTHCRPVPRCIAWQRHAHLWRVSTSEHVAISIWT